MIDMRREILRVLANSSTTLRKITGALSEPSRSEDVAVVLDELMSSGHVVPFADRGKTRYKLTRHYTMPVAPPSPQPTSKGTTMPDFVALMPTPEQETYTRNANGYYVGTDGFVVPRNFEEFDAEYPLYIRDWVRKRAFGKPDGFSHEPLTALLAVAHGDASR